MLTTKLYYLIILLLSINLVIAAPATARQQENNDTYEISLDNVEKFTAAISQIKTFYVSDINDDKLFDDAIKGMLSGLDPHSTYLPPEEYKELYASTMGSFGGLGIEITNEDNFIKVITPLEGTPAQKAGIKPGDFIIQINETSTHNMELKDAVNNMRGKIGTNVTLTIIRKNNNNPIKLDITRELIKIKSVTYDVFENAYGYIKINQFQQSTAQDFIKSINLINQRTNHQLNGLIIDLRNNPGGLLTAAIDISDALIHNDHQGEEEIIVSTKGKFAATNFTAIANPGDIIKGAPIVVLINNGSASGSEIVAGALQDNNRALLVGTKSFGKGSVQTIIPIGNDRGIKLTTSLYYTPKGRSIQAIGIEPDIIIPAKEYVNIENPIISEAQLTGHIKNMQTKQKNVTTTSVPDYLTSDHQLQEAFNILKAMAIAKHG